MPPSVPDKPVTPGPLQTVDSLVRVADVPQSPWTPAPAPPEPAAPLAPARLPKIRPEPTPKEAREVAPLSQVFDPVYGMIHEKAAMWASVLADGQQSDARRLLEALVVYIEDVADIRPAYPALRRCRVGRDKDKTLVQHALQHRDWQALRFLIERGAHEPHIVARDGNLVALGAWGEGIDTGVAWIRGLDGHTQYAGAVSRDWNSKSPQALPQPHGFGYQYFAAAPNRRDYAIEGEWAAGRLQAKEIKLFAGASRFTGRIDANLRFDGDGHWRSYCGEEVIGKWSHGALLSDGVVAMREDGVALDRQVLEGRIPGTVDAFLAA